MKIGKRKVTLKNALIDDGYTGTICFPDKYAEALGIKKRVQPEHDLILGDGSRVPEFAYALGRKTAELSVCSDLLFRLFIVRLKLVSLDQR